MEKYLSLIIQMATLLTMIVGAILFVRKPQEDLETRQSVMNKDVANKATLVEQKEVENKAILLAEQVKWEKEANQAKFSEMSCKITEAMTLAENHIHTVDTKVDKLIDQVNGMALNIGSLSSIIDERIPKK